VPEVVGGPKAEQDERDPARLPRSRAAGRAASVIARALGAGVSTTPPRERPRSDVVPIHSYARTAPGRVSDQITQMSTAMISSDHHG
jgi:hypothetical protein